MESHIWPLLRFVYARAIFGGLGGGGDYGTPLFSDVVSQQNKLGLNLLRSRVSVVWTILALGFLKLGFL